MIWFIDDYAGSPFHGMEYRHYYMAKSLQKMGKKSLIISASYSHQLNIFPPIRDKPYLFEKVDLLNYLWLKVINYGKGNSKKRILKWFQFGIKLLTIKKITHSKPDIIICSCSAPFLIFPCYYLAKRYNAKLIFQVKDLWPLTLMEIGGYSPYNPLIYLMQKSINFAFQKSDIVVSLLPHVNRYIEEQGIKNYNFEYLPNGIFLEEVENALPLNKETRSKIPSDKFIIGYAGAMGLGDNLDKLIELANQLKEYKQIHIVLVGKGLYKETIKKRIDELKLDNISLLESIPKREIQTLLKYFDVCYIGWKEKKIYNYGISANKIFDYMYSKKPILHLYSGAGDLISEARCGITVTQQSSKLLLEALLKLYNMSQKERDAMGERGYNFVIKHHTYQVITEKFVSICQKHLS